MTNCGKCHRCRGPIQIVLDGEEWCEACQTYQRPASHGWRDAYTFGDRPCPT